MDPDDPAYLFRRHQHTRVDLAQLSETITDLLEDVASPLPRPRPQHDHWILPGRAWGVACGVKAVKDKEGVARPYLDVRWEEPVNGRYLDRFLALKYEVMVKSMGADGEEEDLLKEATTKERFVTVHDVNFRKVERVLVWVTTVQDGDLRGAETRHKCELDVDVEYKK